MSDPVRDIEAQLLHEALSDAETRISVKQAALDRFMAQFDDDSYDEEELPDSGVSEGLSELGRGIADGCFALASAAIVVAGWAFGGSDGALASVPVVMLGGLGWSFLRS